MSIPGPCGIRNVMPNTNTKGSLSVSLVVSSACLKIYLYILQNQSIEEYSDISIISCVCVCVRACTILHISFF